MLADIRKIIRALPVKRGRAFLIRHLSFFPAYRFDYIKVFGHNIKIDLKDNAAIGLYLNFGDVLFEKEIFTFLKSVVNSDDVFWDVGANIGYYTLYLADRCRVFAFEPNPQLSTNLKNSVFNYSNVTILNYALSNVNEQRDFYLNDGSSNLSSFINNGLNSVLRLESKIADDLIKNKEVASPTIIKIDVEGYEYQVLEGFKLVDTYKPIIIFEYINEFGVQTKIKISDIIDLLGKDWSIFRFMLNGKIEADYFKDEGATNNYLALNKSSNNFKRIEEFIIK